MLITVSGDNIEQYKMLENPKPSSAWGSHTFDDRLRFRVWVYCLLCIPLPLMEKLKDISTNYTIQNKTGTKVVPGSSYKACV